MKQGIRARKRDLPRGVFICMQLAEPPLRRTGARENDKKELITRKGQKHGGNEFV
jgi:hypothetical protein